MVYADEQERYQGDWVNGIRQGKGMYIKDGTLYTGEFVNDALNG